MIHLKGCQRCGGDLKDSADKDGDYWECLQCGDQTYPGLSASDRTAKDGWRMKKKGKL